MRRVVVLGRILGGVAAAFAALTLAACTSSGSYRAAVSGNPCTTRSSPWAEYGKILRGQNPCVDDCNNPCACAAPAAPCAAAPCARPCAKPCEKPCATPCAKPCAKPCGKPCGCSPCGGSVASAPCGAPAPCAAPLEVMCKVEVPPVYETVYENVETECPRCTQLWVPPVKQIRMRDVCVRPPCTCEIDIPAVHRTETYCVEICPAHDEVVPGECGCTKTIRIPARTETRTREICITPPERKVVYEPALYRTDAVPCDVKPGYWQTVTTPGVVERRPRIVCKTPGRTEWVRSPCAPGAPMPPGAVPIPSGAMPPINPDRQPGDPVPPPPPPPTEPTPTPMPVAPK